MTNIEEVHAEVAKRTQSVAELMNATRSMSDMNYLQLSSVLHELGDIAVMMATVQLMK